MSMGWVEPRCYLLSVDAPVRRVLGSLSDPGIFQGPGETVVFLPAAAAAAAALLLVILWGRLGRLSPRPRSGSLVLGWMGSESPCCSCPPPPMWRSASSLLLPLACGSRGLLGDRVDSLLTPLFRSLDLPLLLLEVLASSLPPSPSEAGCTLCPLWVDLPPSLLALPLPPAEGALLPWPVGSGLSSSGFWGLLERSFLPSPAARSRGTSRGGR